MSAPTHLERCRQWLQEQIDAMGTLRTANVRDLSFKNWRQNTVTAIQRIWPDDLERVERFRRIVFTPPHSRADAKLTREWFGKGIGESRTYLQTLLEIVDREGVPPPAEHDRDDGAESMEAEVGFPMLDLSGSAPASGGSATDEPPPAEAGELGFTPGYTSPDDQGASPRDPQSPGPPSLRMNWKAPSLSELRRREGPAAEAPPALGGAEDEDDRSAANDDRPVVEIPRAPSLPPAEAAPAAKVEPAASAPPAKAEPAASAPAAKAEPSPPAPARPAFPAPPAPMRAKADAASAARREAPARASGRGRNGRGKPKKSGGKPKLKDLLGLAEFDSRAQGSYAEAPAEPAAPAPPPVAVTPPAAKPEPAPPPAEPVVAAAPPPAAAIAPPAAAEPEAGDDEANEEDRERATLDFMQNSPIFGMVGRPVQRRTDTTEFLDPDAVAVATLAADLGRLGVPEGMRPSLAARLVDVARRLEAGDLDWSLLRAAVTDAMQYPDLARRLLPVLLPWLERAA